MSTALKQFASDSLKTLIELNYELVIEKLKSLGLMEITIDLDGTVISTQGHPSWSFKGYNPIRKGAKSYFPLTSHIAETGHFLSIINRLGIHLKDKTVLSSPEMLVQGIEVKIGQATKKTIEFVQEGTLELTAVKGGKPLAALFYMYTHGKKRLVKNGYLPANKPGVFKLLAGKYDIILTDKTVLNKSEQVLAEIEVISLQTTQKTVEFPLEGTLEITAVKGGQPFEPLLYIYPQGKNIYIKSGYLPRNKPGVYKLLPGAYDLKALNKTDKTKKELNGVAVQSGQARRVKIRF